MNPLVNLPYIVDDDKCLYQTNTVRTKRRQKTVEGHTDKVRDGDRVNERQIERQTEREREVERYREIVCVCVCLCVCLCVTLCLCVFDLLHQRKVRIQRFNT